MSPVILQRCNRRVTCSPDPHNDRSESAVVVNPLDSYNIVGASKKFTDPHTYAFSLAAYASFDGGQSWTEAAPLQDAGATSVVGRFLQLPAFIAMYLLPQCFPLTTPLCNHY
jgi:hypothetical protein